MTQDLDDLRAVGAITGIDQVLSAYRVGLFPMGLGEGGAGPIGWWAPLRRGVLLPGRLRVSRSLRRSMRRYRTSVDEAFAEVVAGCADPERDGAWISPEIADVYAELHATGHAHSIEVWEGSELVGGLYGVAFGGVFCGESMFHTRTDTSKVALVELVARLDAAAETAGEDASGGNVPGGDRPGGEAPGGEKLGGDVPGVAAAASGLDPNHAGSSDPDGGETVGGWLIDTQWCTPHLASLGVSEMSAVEYLQALDSAAQRSHCQGLLTK